MRYLRGDHRFQQTGPEFVVFDADDGAFAIMSRPIGIARSSGKPLILLELVVGTFEPQRAELEAIASGFSLTEAETSVLGLLACGHAIGQIATIRQVKVETIRRQCKTVLAKLRCHRQVDLVRLVFSLCSAARSGGVF